MSTASNMDSVIQRMQALATNQGDTHRRSKRDRACMRGLFRRLCGAIEGQEGGSGAATLKRKLKLRHGDVLVVEDLTRVLQLDLLRRFLAEGFQAHLQVRVHMCCCGAVSLCAVGTPPLGWVQHARIGDWSGGGNAGVNHIWHTGCMQRIATLPGCCYAAHSGRRSQQLCKVPLASWLDAGGQALCCAGAGQPLPARGV